MQKPAVAAHVGEEAVSLGNELHETAKALEEEQCKTDVVLMIQGSGAMGTKAWNAEIELTKNIVNGIRDCTCDVQLSIVAFSGPNNWSGVRKCFKKEEKLNDQSTLCRVKTSAFTNDMSQLDSFVNGLKYLKGATLLSSAFERAGIALKNHGREGAKKIVIAMGNARPLSAFRVNKATKKLRSKGMGEIRVMYIPVTRYSNMRAIKQWVSRRWQENVVPVTSTSASEVESAGSRVVGAFCQA